MWKIYTDGSCVGNPWPGGRAAVLQQKTEIKNQKAGKEVILTWGETVTTNNQMELQAVIEVLEEIRRRRGEWEKKQVLPWGVGLFATEPEEQISEEIHIRTDSNYVKLGVTERLSTRKRRNRRRAKGGKLIENLDRRQRLAWLLEIFPQVHRYRVKGHAGDTLNEQVDTLARQEAEKRSNN